MATPSSSKPTLTTIYAPLPLPSPHPHPTIFLSGTTTIRWRDTLTSHLSSLNRPLTIIDPLRPDWDSSWRPHISFAPFHEQVNWELDMMEAADIIFIYLHPGTESPVTMLEFGLWAKNGKVVVCCPEGYLRYGNVQVLCERFGVQMVERLEDVVGVLEARFRGMETKDGGKVDVNDAEGKKT